MQMDELRKQIHGYIDQADDRFVNLVHAMMMADLDEATFEITEETKKLLDERLHAHQQKLNEGSPLNEAFARINQQL
ncbi:MAG: hypothetical protein ACK5RG_08975 [Cyclobacteriaceae bacterium]|jgi:hypothetical protein|nr:hypothetical protein [Flammeovirgaceae bacterium]